MRAAVTRAFGEPLVVEEIHLDGPRRGEVRVGIAAVAVCGSDLHAGDGAWGGTLPAVYGHEAAGIVREVGDGVTGLAAGDRVVVTLLRVCGECFYCRNGQRYLCAGRFELDTSTRLRDDEGRPVVQGIYVGAFAQEVVVHHSQVVKLPAGIPLDGASLLACGVLTGYGAVTNTAAVPPGSSVVVVGLGGVGINAVQGAAAVGAAPIIGVDVAAAKLPIARNLGATDSIAADDPSLRHRVLAATGERGADFVFVAVGKARVVEWARTLVRPGGTLVVVGMGAADEHARIDISQFPADAHHVIGSRMGSADPARDIPYLAGEYLAGRLHLDELITGRFALDDINEAIASTRAGDALRNVIVFPGVGS